MTSWNPWRVLARRPGITLVRTHLPEGEQGRYYPDQDAVVLDRRLGQAQERCTLTHELVHRERGDRHVDCVRLAARQELACRREAARRLITVEALAAALMWGRDPEEIADELWVDLATLFDFIAGMSSDENAYIRRRIAAREGAA